MDREEQREATHELEDVEMESEVSEESEDEDDDEEEIELDEGDDESDEPPGSKAGAGGGAAASSGGAAGGGKRPEETYDRAHLRWNAVRHVFGVWLSCSHSCPAAHAEHGGKVLLLRPAYASGC